MRKKLYTTGITFFTTPEMYQELKNNSDKLEISLSEFLRNLIDKYLNSIREINNVVTERKENGSDGLE